MGATHIAMVDSSLSQADANKMINQMKDLDGVKTVLGIDSILIRQYQEISFRRISQKI